MANQVEPVFITLLDTIRSRAYKLHITFQTLIEKRNAGNTTASDYMYLDMAAKCIAVELVQIEIQIRDMETKLAQTK